MDKNENEWIYKLKETHAIKVNGLEDDLKKANLKITHLSEMIQELNEILENEREDLTEIKNGFVKVKQKLKDELFFNGKTDIDCEMLTNDFMQKVS